MTRGARAASLAIVLISAWAVAPVRAEDDPWADLRFLIGTWVSEGKPEAGSGKFSLEPDLQNKVLVRRNVAKIPAAPGRPGGKHEDLMVIYRDPDSKTLRASYFDSEGHVIAYAVAPLAEKTGLEFLSSADAKGPRFRLTYTKGEADKVAVKFEIAPPGKPEGFRTYLEGVVRRAKQGE
jgi:hypothetical protein